MMKLKHTVLSISTALLFAGCANTPQPPLYSWGDYVKSSTRYGMDGHNKEVLEQHTAELKKIIDESETNKQKVAPGLYAEYGQILFETGKKEDAKRYFFLEKTTYPESATFINQVIKKLYGEG